MESSESVTLITMNQMIDIALGATQPNVINFELINQILKIIVRHVKLNEARIQVNGRKSLDIQQITSKPGTGEQPDSGKSLNVIQEPRTDHRSAMSAHIDSIFSGSDKSSRDTQYETGPVYPASPSERGRKSAESPVYEIIPPLPASPSQRRKKSAESPAFEVIPPFPAPPSKRGRKSADETNENIPPLPALPSGKGRRSVESNQEASPGYPGKGRRSVESNQEASPGYPSTPSERKKRIIEEDERSDIGFERRMGSIKSSQESVIVIDDSGEPKVLEHTLSISMEQIKWIFESINSLQRQINELRYLPNNKDLLERVSSSRRISMKKISGSGIQNEEGEKSTIGSSSNREERDSRETPIVDMYQTLSLLKRIEGLEEGMEKLASLIEDVARDLNVPLGKTSSDQRHELEKKSSMIRSISDLKGESAAVLGNKGALDLFTREIAGLKKLVLGDSFMGDDDAHDANVMTKMIILEVKIKQIMDQVYAMDRVTNEQISNLFGQCDSFVDHFKEIRIKLDENAKNANAPSTDLVIRLEKIENIIGLFNNDYKKMVAHDNQRNLEMSTLLEQMEVLKINKVDKEEFLKALEQKIDYTEIGTKVSQDKFLTTCDDIRTNLNEAILKLSEQEEMWQKALFEIQTEMMTKLEKKELGTLQNFIKDKLDRLQQKMKAIKKFQQEKQAAATKQQLLKNMKCLSCDTNVYMTKKSNINDYPQSPILPPEKGIAPYLTYELDILRKQKNSQIATRNLHHFESARKNRPDNRYCGGPHTVTTPVQRVTRVGHFLEQWGPELSETDHLIKGRDGNIYFGRENVDIFSPKQRETTVMNVANHILQQRQQRRSIDRAEKDDDDVQKGEMKFKENSNKKRTTKGLTFDENDERRKDGS